jgi:long-chain acyl-CoA synthetase
MLPTTRPKVNGTRPQQFLEKPSLPLRALRWLLFRFNRMLMRSVFQLCVKGIDRLPVDGPFVITPNHVSYLDPLAIAAALPVRLMQNTCWAGWAGKMHKGPVSRAVSRSMRIFPVDPDHDLGSSIQLGAQALDDGRILVWFPEGGRSPNGVTREFRHGIGVLLENSRAVVVPAWIEGSFQAWPRSRKWPRPRRITVVFGEPKTVDSLLGEGPREADASQISDALKHCVTRLRI